MLSLETKGAGGPWDRVVLGTADYQWRTQPSLEAPLEKGSWYTLRMVAKGIKYQIFLDDELIIETESTRPSFAKGLAGFGIKNVEMHFDDFILTGDDIPENLEPASPELIETMGLKPMIPEKLTAVSPRARLTTTWGQAKAH